jgi:hypothetical protein
MPTEKEYVKFVNKELKKILHTPLAKLDDGSYMASSAARYKHIHPKDIWYLLTLIFLNSPNNSKYVKLLILLLDRPKISIYKKCQQYYKIYTKNKKQDYSMYEKLDIDSFKYDSKVYPLLKELMRRLIVLKNGDYYYINPDLFTVNIYMRKFVMGKDTDFMNKITNNDNASVLVVQDWFDSNPFDDYFVQRLFEIISNIPLNLWKRLLTLEKFSFNSLYMTWVNIVEDIELIKKAITSEDKTKLTSELVFSYIDWPVNDAKEEKKLKDKIRGIDSHILDEYIKFLAFTVQRNVEIINNMGKSILLELPLTAWDKDGKEVEVVKSKPLDS